MNNTKLKELGLWIEPSDDCLAIRAEKKRLNRLFNPKKFVNKPSDETLRIRKKIKKLRRFKYDNCIIAYKLVNDIGYKVNIKLRVIQPSTYERNETQRLLLGLKSIKDLPKDIIIIPHKDRILPKCDKRFKRRKPSKPSLFEIDNISIRYEHGYIPRKSKKPKFARTISNKQVIPEIWSEELHQWTRPRQVFVKKDKSISPYWQNKIAEWEGRYAS